MVDWSERKIISPQPFTSLRIIKCHSTPKMGDSDSGVMPGVDSVFWQFGVGVGTGVKYFLMTGVGTGVGVKPLAWSLESEPELESTFFGIVESKPESESNHWPGVGVGIGAGTDQSRPSLLYTQKLAGHQGCQKFVNLTNLGCPI